MAKPIPWYRKYKLKPKSAKQLREMVAKGKLRHNSPAQSWLKGKKLVVLAKRKGETKTVHFGDKRYEDYTMHGDEERRKNYRKRSKGLGGLSDVFSANYWARKILW